MKTTILASLLLNMRQLTIWWFNWDIFFCIFFAFCIMYFGKWSNFSKASKKTATYTFPLMAVGLGNLIFFKDFFRQWQQHDFNLNCNYFWLQFSWATFCGRVVDAVPQLLPALNSSHLCPAPNYASVYLVLLINKN